ncbi:MAG: hypothetical protein D8M58_01140 [Calditrichaeota bacterium]|nr:MAG: hypothetical protein DWQ03_05940 [Calditrichota bacterium]MBL1203973.1 hypothetical protein [Calditrichota bacterium]NOG43804.1 hypothetical protein [Calditrichota bacterium]
MGPIRQLFSTSPDLKKAESNKKIGKPTDNDPGAKETNAAGNASKDQVEISNKGRELLSLKVEAENYLKEIKESEVISPQEVDAIKEKIASKYYFDEDVISDLVDKLVNLPDYMNR